MIDNTTPLVTIPRPDLGDDIRRVVAANALSVINVEAADPRTRPLLEDLLGPVHGRWDLDRPFRAELVDGKWRTQGVSTCGLVAEGLWRRAGVDAPWLSEEYRFGEAITRARRFAAYLQPRSAWHLPTVGARPKAGDYVVIGTGLQTHALTCIGWEDDLLVSVDGGQVGARGLQAIHRVTRPWRAAGTAATLGGRVVVGWVAPEMLPGLESCQVPEGWEAVEV